MTNHEFKELMLTRKTSSLKEQLKVHTHHFDVSDIPTEVDWRTKGVVTNIAN